MKKTGSKKSIGTGLGSASRPILFGWVLTLLLALLGQWFILQRQNAWALTPGGIFFGLSISLLFFLVRKYPGASPLFSSLSDRLETILFFGILGLSIFLRAFRLPEIPSGIARDEASLAAVALDMLHGQLVPLQDLYHSDWTHYHVADAYYALAGWFYLFTPSKTAFCALFVLISVGSLCFTYWFFRQLAGPASALICLFILSIMQWHITLSRNGHSVIFTQVYIFGCLSFVLYGFRKLRLWPFGIAALFLGSGFYSYPTFKVFPLLVILIFGREWITSSIPKSFLGKALGLLTGLSLLIAFPLLMDMFQAHYLTVPGYGSSFIWAQIKSEKSFHPIFNNLAQIFLSLNRSGDPTPTYDVPYHRLLDDLTAVFFTLGLAYACFRPFERKHFYGLAGGALMLLPALLSTSPYQSTRFFGIAPFVGFLAGEGLTLFRAHLGDKKNLWANIAFLFFIPLAMLYQNYHVYFVERPSDPLCWHWADTEANIVGQRIAEGKDGYEYYLSPVFDGNFSTQFQCMDQQAHTRPLDLPAAMSLPVPPGDRGLYFFLQEGRTGVLSLLQTLYPGGTTEKILDPVGRPSLYLYRIPHEIALQDLEVLSKKGTSSSLTGLLGVYRLSTDWTVKPAFIQRDPLINFSSHNDFPVKTFPPLSVHWSGKIEVQVSGNYRFLVLTDDQAKATVNGVSFAQSEEKGMALKKGRYPLEIFYQKTQGLNTCLHFLWKKPGSDHYEVVPYQAFRN